jgi:hypothetical protein
MKRIRIIEIISGLFILLFIYTSASKVIDFDGYLFDLRNQPFPNWIASLIAWVVPISELMIAGLHFFDKTRLFAMYLSLILMGLFTIYAASILFNMWGQIPCSCGGIIKYLKWPQHLIFNIFFVSLAIVGIVLLKRQISATVLICKFK